MCVHGKRGEGSPSAKAAQAKWDSWHNTYDQFAEKSPVTCAEIYPARLRLPVCGRRL